MAATSDEEISREKNSFREITHSRLFSAHEMEWNKTRFNTCLHFAIYFDCRRELQVLNNFFTVYTQVPFDMDEMEDEMDETQKRSRRQRVKSVKSDKVEFYYRSQW